VNVKLSDVMSAMNLASYAEVALLLFFAAFIAVVIWVFRQSNARHWESAREMPLDDEHPQEPRSKEHAT